MSVLESNQAAARSQPSWRPTKGFESRARWVESIEVRAADDEDGRPILRGHAAVFDKLSVPLWGFREKIKRGAFRESIGQDDIRALVEHQGGLSMLGRNTSSPPTLRLKEDKVGLSVEIEAPDTSAGRDVLELVKRGDLSQMSFGFETRDDSWETVDGEEIRTLKRVRLFDVSIVTFPAYEDSDVALRSLEIRSVSGPCAIGRLATARRWLETKARVNGHQVEVSHPACTVVHSA